MALYKEKMREWEAKPVQSRAVSHGLGHGPRRGRMVAANKQPNTTTDPATDASCQMSATVDRGLPPSVVALEVPQVQHH